MSASRFERIREVFLRVQDAEGAERAATLDALCAGDADLRREVESLMGAAPGGADRFLEPPTGPMERVTPGAGPMEMPKAIGPYKLLQVIGEGGFGVVYMAEQEKPVRRRVALKVIRLGMDTKHVLARFEAERQALAMMDHPNIARVLDAGATEAGRPYFVMELVRGVPITEYCDHEKLGTRARLELFIAVCRAVQHAHQKGIIHRDIKPSNVMVTLHDGAPVPKVIDFGIAKATNARLTERTLFTEFHQFIGTPEYMSPEQAEMSGLDIDTRSDIYSLGVLLYELLAGVTPLDGAKLRSEGWVGMQRLIRDFEPIRPSVRLSAESEVTTAAARNRGVGIAELKRSLVGDLDWIAMRALEKDRSRRYETASAFAADIERYLRNEPIEARPPSVAYRARKFIRRNSGAVAVASIIAIGLVVSATGFGVLFARERAASVRAAGAEANERSQRERAQASLARAEESEAGARAALERSQRVTRLLKSALGGEHHAEQTVSRETLASEMLVDFQAKIAEMHADDPEVQVELLETLSRSYLRLGMYERSHEAMREALAIARTHWPPEHINVVALVIAEAWYGRAVESGEQRATLEALLPTLGGGEPWDDLRARALFTLASKYAVAAEAGRAVDLYREALATNAGLAAPDPILELNIRDGLAYALFQASRFAEAVVESETLARLAPLGDRPDFNTLRRWWRHGSQLYDLGHVDAGLDALRRTAEASDRSLGPQNAETTPRWNFVAEYLYTHGRLDEAEAVTSRARAILGSEDRPGDLMHCLKVSAWIALARGDRAAAERCFREVVDVAAGAGHGGFNDPNRVWRESQVWLLTMDRRQWSDDALRRAIRATLDHVFVFASDPTDLKGGFVNWGDMRWSLIRHGDADAREGSRSELLALRDLPQGVYALRIRAPRESGPELDVHGWFLLADWTVREFPIDGYAGDHPERFAAGERDPAVTRDERYLEVLFEPGWRPGPNGRMNGFGLVAECAPSIPSGEYRVRVLSDDGERFTVGDTVITEAWLGRSAAMDEGALTISAGNQSAPWRVDYFQGADWLDLKFEVTPDGAARAVTLAKIGITE
jgi:serine/threonine protein kinase